MDPNLTLSFIEKWHIGVRCSASRLLSHVACALCSGFLGLPASSASLSLLAALPGRDFDISHAGTEFAAFDDGSVCVYSVIDPGLDKKCFSVPINPGRAVPQVRWAPDDSALAVSAEDFADTPGIWILRLAGANGTPTRIHTGRPPGPGSGGDAIEAFLNSSQLITSPRYGGFAIFDVQSGATSSCEWDETDGRTEWISDHALVVGTNHFGALQVAKVTGAPGEANLSCSPTRRAESTPSGLIWHQFEAVLAPDRLLYSQQRYDSGQSWEIGSSLVALNATTLEFVAEYPPGAPASVSPKNDLIAALRRDSGGGIQIVFYQVSDHLPILEMPSASGVSPWPLVAAEWSALRPKWSLDGQYVLIVENHLMAAEADLISIADGTIDHALKDIPKVLQVEWTTGNRLIVGTQLDGIRVYELVRDYR